LSTKEDNNEQIVLPDKMFTKALIIKDNLQKELVQATGDPSVTDEHFVTIWKILRKGTSNKYPDYERKDDPLYCKGHLFIRHGGFRKDLMQKYHDHPTAGQKV
jgi:hypothetical protein